MPSSPEVEAARAQVFQLIGRNVLRFQQMELMLKDMISKSRISVTLGESPDDRERRSQAIHKKTMGLLAGQLFDEAILGQPPSDEPTFFPEADKAVANGKAHIGIAFKLHLSEEDHALWKERFQKLIDERNELVHASLRHMNLETLDGCNKEIAALEDQRSRISAEFEHIKRLHQSISEGVDIAAAAMLNPEILKSMVMDQNEAELSSSW